MSEILSQVLRNIVTAVSMFLRVAQLLVFRGMHTPSPVENLFGRVLTEFPQLEKCVAVLKALPV